MSTKPTGKPGALDELEDLMPKDIVVTLPQSLPSVTFDLEGIAGLTPLEKTKWDMENKIRRDNMRKLAGRKLDTEITLLMEFLALGRDSAKVRLSLSEARSTKYRLYQARAQARMRELPGHEALERLSFREGEDSKGGFLQIKFKPTLVFELDEDGG